MSTTTTNVKIQPEETWRATVLADKAEGAGSPETKTMVEQMQRAGQSTPCCCVLVFVITFVLLFVLQPPMVMQKSEVAHETPRVSVVAIVCWSLFAAVGTFVVSVAVK